MDRAAVSEAANLGSNPGGSTSLCMSEAICEGGLYTHYDRS